MKWEKADDIKKTAIGVVKKFSFDNVDIKRIIFFRSWGSKARARARIWAFPRIWQLALRLPAHYIVEVISERFDYLSSEEKIKIIIHELLHIPKNFSGSLISHNSRWLKINNKTVNQIFKKVKDDNITRR